MESYRDQGAFGRVNHVNRRGRMELILLVVVGRGASEGTGSGTDSALRHGGLNEIQRGISTSYSCLDSR